MQFPVLIFGPKNLSANSYTFCNYGTQHHINTSTDAFWLLFIKTNRIWPSSSPMWWYAQYVQGVECNIIKKRLAFILDMTICTIIMLHHLQFIIFDNNYHSQYIILDMIICTICAEAGRNIKVGLIQKQRQHAHTHSGSVALSGWQLCWCWW